MSEPTFFDDVATLRAWADSHARDESEAWLGFHRIRYGVPVTRAPRVQDATEAFADLGWVEAERHALDDDRYAVRFAPGKPRRRPAPVEVPEEGWEPPVMAAEYEARMREDPAASAFFDAQPPRYQRAAVWWVMGGKAEETRERRIATLIEACAKGEKLMQLQRNL